MSKWYIIMRGTMTMDQWFRVINGDSKGNEKEAREGSESVEEGMSS